MLLRALDRVFTFFVVLVLLILLIELLGGFIASSVGPVGTRIGEILHNAWVGVQNIAHVDSHVDPYVDSHHAGHHGH